MEPEKVRLRTYQQVWSQEHTIYQIERVRLPFPITFRQAGTFAVAFLAVFLLARIPGLDRIPGLFTYILVPGLVTWFLTSQRLDGKAPLRWLLSVLRYLVSPKRMNRLRTLPPAERRIRYRGNAAWRLKG